MFLLKILLESVVGKLMQIGVFPAKLEKLRRDYPAKKSDFSKKKVIKIVIYLSLCGYGKLSFKTLFNFWLVMIEI